MRAWFISGVSSGLGRALAEKALSAGGSAFFRLALASSAATLGRCLSGVGRDCRNPHPCPATTVSQSQPYR
jgi:NAD(P)-dependent dehydrogenase (short-subunit alcohol dehydrogenase family)